MSEGVQLSTAAAGQISKNWVLLDNQSTVDVFCNEKLLTNVRESDTSMEIHCNAGVSSTRMAGDLRGYGTVWFNPDEIANIISLSRMKERYHITKV